MTLRVYTARIGSPFASRPDALDITRGSGQEGPIFAPSWEILRPLLAIREATTRDLHGAATPAARSELGVLYAHAWALYTQAYRLEMRESLRKDRPAWDAMLAREELTLLCYCVEPDRCHRTLLGRTILTQFKTTKVTFHGERR